MKKFRFSGLSAHVKNFRNKRIMVIGDLLLDHYIWGDVSRISPEAPVPVVWVKREDHMPGGSCNVASNLAALGADVSIVGVIGDDDRGDTLRNELHKRDIKTNGIFTDSSRPTSLKTRVIAHHQQVCRIDRESVDTVEGAVASKMVEFAAENVKDFDAVVIEDYGKGVITPGLLKKVVPVARKNNKVISVDPKENHFSYYKGASVITPNHHEAAKAVGFTLRTFDDIVRAGETMLKKLRTDSILITLGEKGMMLFEKGRTYQHIPTVAQEVFDVSGAGDTVIAVFTLARAAGASPHMSAYIANCAAGIVVGKIGAATVTHEELLSRLKVETGRK